MKEDADTGKDTPRELQGAAGDGEVGFGWAGRGGGVGAGAVPPHVCLLPFTVRSCSVCIWNRCTPTMIDYEDTWLQTSP